MLKDFEVNIRIKLSLLWAGVTFFYIYGDYFELYVPNKVEGLLSGDHLLDEPGKLFLASVVLAIPSSMIFLSTLLKPIWSKWLNITFGIIFTAMMLLIAVTSTSSWRAFYVFYALVESMITAGIVWTAMKWPKQEG